MELPDGVKITEFRFSDPDSVMVIQVPRPTNQLSDIYIRGIREELDKYTPPGRCVYIVGSDVNFFELTGLDCTALKIKGLI